MTVDPRAVELVKRFEGLRQRAYKDGGGVWTIGYGHTAGVIKGDTCTTEQADAWLKEDLAEALAAVDRHIPVALTASMRGALASLVFNCGAIAVRDGNTISRSLREGNYAHAWAAIALWRHVDGVPSLGLMRRRAAEMALFWEDGRAE